MTNIDDKIREALKSDEAELLDEYAGEQSLLDQALDVWRGRHRWIVLLGWLVSVGLMGFAVASAIMFFKVESTRAMIAWSMGFVFGLLAVSLLKVWFWMEMNKNAVTREVKRVELQIARLSKTLRRD